MLPAQARVVLYHFEHRDDDGVFVMRHRPALVIGVSQHADLQPRGIVALHVFYHPSDDDPNPSDFPSAKWSSIRDAVPAHIEGASGEVGVVMREQPKPRSWSWPPRV